MLVHTFLGQSKESVGSEAVKETTIVPGSLKITGPKVIPSL